jgi:hypothetical protein
MPYQLLYNSVQQEVLKPVQTCLPSFSAMCHYTTFTDHGMSDINSLPLASASVHKVAYRKFSSDQHMAS